MKKMNQILEELLQSRKQVSVNFPAPQGTKLISASGIVTEVGEDYLILTDIYGNTMLMPIVAISYIEIKK